MTAPNEWGKKGGGKRGKKEVERGEKKGRGKEIEKKRKRNVF